jgi:hypothetical protein
MITVREMKVDGSFHSIERDRNKTREKSALFCVGHCRQRARASPTSTDVSSDGKQQLGLGDCQVRSGAGQTRHVYLVSAAYSLLTRSLQQSRAQDWARRTLTTIGEACRAVKAETLARMIDWLVEKLTAAHWSITDMKDVLVYS